MQIDVQDLTIARGGVALLSGVSFSVPASEAVILRGPNGLGKTTLLRTLAGLQPPLAGTVQVPEDSVAYAAHADGLKTMLSVAENLEFWAAVFGAGSIEPALDAFDLHSLRTRRAGTLSAGQKRRLGLARLLVTGRPIWILDEPTVSLDAASVTQFGQVMAAHLGKGGSAVLATHIDLGLIGARTLELGVFKARPDAMTSTSDEAFL